jgi:dihydrofolate reductase
MPDRNPSASGHFVPHGYHIHGHAIVSRDDMIAGADGATPAALRNDADWARFQAALDAAAVTVLGRFGHEVNPNPDPDRRRRLVVTGRVATIERGGDAWWWNPAGCGLAEALERVAPNGGVVAVPGGQAVFDLFLAIGYHEFHLARAQNVTVGEGRTLFSGLGQARGAEAALSEGGLVAAESMPLDPAAGVTLTLWRRRDRFFGTTRR